MSLEGHEVRSATEAEGGYSIFLLFQPDLVITDIHMPRQNGMELMQKIRMNNPMIKTIYISGYLSEWIHILEEERLRYPVSVLNKPFSTEELMQSIAKLF